MATSNQFSNSLKTGQNSQKSTPHYCVFLKNVHPSHVDLNTDLLKTLQEIASDYFGPSGYLVQLKPDKMFVFIEWNHQDELRNFIRFMGRSRFLPQVLDPPFADLNVDDDDWSIYQEIYCDEYPIVSRTQLRWFRENCTARILKKHLKAHATDMDFEEDLTKEGIEPNPGPDHCYTVIFNDVPFEHRQNHVLYMHIISNTAKKYFGPLYIDFTIQNGTMHLVIQFNNSKEIRQWGEFLESLGSIPYGPVFDYFDEIEDWDQEIQYHFDNFKPTLNYDRLLKLMRKIDKKLIEWHLEEEATDADFEKDLTEEGIEPNPGPVVDVFDFVDKVIQRLRGRCVSTEQKMDIIEYKFFQFEEETTDADWVRDLTEEGIEPNPGPTYYVIDNDEFIEWLKLATKSDINHHQVRSRLYEILNEMIVFEKQDGKFFIYNRDYIALKTVLTTPDRGLSNDAMMNFANLTNELLSAHIAKEERKGKEAKEEEPLRFKAQMKGEVYKPPAADVNMITDVEVLQFITLCVKKNFELTDADLTEQATLAMKNNLDSANEFVQIFVDILEKLRKQSNFIYVDTILLGKFKGRITKREITTKLQAFVAYMYAVLETRRFKAQMFKREEKKEDKASVFDTANQIKKTREEIKEQAERALPIFSSFGAEFKRFNDNCDATRKWLTSITQSVPETFRDYFFKALTLISVIVAAVVTKQNSVRAILLVALAGIVAPTVIDIIIPIILDFQKEIKTDEEIQTGVLSNESIVLPQHKEHAFIAMGKVFYNMFQSLDESARKEDLFRISVFRGYTTAVKSAKDLIEFLMNAFKGAANIWYEHYYGYPYGADPIMIENIEAMGRWIEKALELTSQDHQPNLKISAWRANIERLYTDGQWIIQSVKDQKMESTRVQLFMRTYAQVEKLYKMIQNYCRQDHGRVRPVTIFLVGPPNQGKSVLADMLLKDICDLFDFEYSANAKYVRNVKEEFWSNYQGQVCTIYDDPFMVDDKEERTKIMQEFISMCNNMSFPLNVPVAEEKGHVFFESKIVIVTSNTMTFEANHKLISPEAFRRRFDFVIKVEKFPRKEGDNELGWNDKRYKLTNMIKTFEPKYDWYGLDDVVPGAPFSYKSFVQRVASRMVEYGSGGGNIIQYLMEQGPKDWIKEMRDLLMKPNPTLKPLVENTKEEIKVVAQMTRVWNKLFHYYDPPEIIDDMSNPIKVEPDVQPEAVEQPQAIMPDMRPEGAITHKSPESQVSVIETTKDRLTILKEETKQLLLKAKRAFEQWKLALEGAYKENKLAVASAAIIGIVGLIVGAIGLYKALGESTKQDEEEDDDEMEIFEKQGNGVYEKFKIKRRLAKQQMTQRTRAALSRYQVQASDRQTENLVDEVLKKNYCIISIRGHFVAGCFIKERVFITVFHQIKSLLTKNANVSIMYRGQEYVINESVLNIFHPDQRDMVFVRIEDPTFPIASDITNHFMFDTDLNFVTTSPVSLAVFRKGNILEKFTAVPPTPLGYIQYEDENSRVYSNADSYLVGLPTQAGDCGSLYLVHNTKTTRKIFGLHVAGSEASAEAICCILTKDDIDLYFENHSKQNAFKAQSGIYGMPCDILPPELSTLDYHKFECSNVEIIGTVPPQWAPRQPSKTEIVPSPLYNCFHETNFTPAMLAPDRKSGVSPMEVGLTKKLKRERNTYRDPKLRKVCDYVVSKLPNQVKPRILTEHEAINGVQGWSYVNGIDTSTSPGWPYTKEQNKMKGKMSFLKGQVGNYELRDDVHNRLWEEIAEHKKGNRTYPVIQDQLKDELLPKRKVYETHVKEDGTKETKWIGNTRIMGSSPLHTLIEERMCMGAFVENIMRAQPLPDSFCDIGIDYSRHQPFLQLFTKLSRRAGTKEAWRKMRVAAGDFEKQDATEMEALSWAFRYIMKEWYKRNPEITEEDLTWIDTLDLDLSHVTHLAMNLLYRTWGNPSGRVMTTIKNSFITLILFLMTGINTWMNKDPTLNQKTMNEVFDHVYEAFTCFGDDHVYAFSEDDWFTMFDVRDECAKWGLIYTSCYKDQELKESYEFGEIKYLQRFFTFAHGICRAPLDKQIIEDTPYWMKADQPVAKAVAQNIDSALREAALWGPEYFHDLQTRLNNECLERGLPLNYLKLEDLEARFFGMAPVTARAQTKERWIPYGGMPDQRLTTRVFKAQSGTVSESERQENNNPIETVVTTTTFADNVGKQDPHLNTPTNVSPALTGADPYPDQGMGTVLSRPYPVITLNWQSTDVMGSLLGIYTFPDLLYQIPNIKEKLNRFEYLQSACRVSVRLNATSFHSGKLMIAWLPHYNPDNGINNAFQNVYVGSCLSSVILSANTTVPVDFVIPYVAPSTYWNMKDTSTAVGKGWFGAFAIFVLAPLRLVSSTTTQVLKVNVYANFENPKVAGLGLRNALPPPPDGKGALKYQRRFKPQSGKEQAVRSEDNTISSKAEQKTPMSFGKVITNLVSPIVDVGSKILGGALASGLGVLNKPTSTQAVQKYVPKTVTSFANASGLDGCDKLAMDPENKVATDTSIYADKRDYSSFDNYKMLPGLIRMTSFTESDTIGTKVLILPITPTLCGEDQSGDYLTFFPTPLANLASFFKFWRGSIKFHIMFTCSRFTTARVRITWLPDPTFIASIVAAEEGDTVNKIVDITGDTSVSITVPYLKDTYWADVLDPQIANDPEITSWFGFNGQLVVTVVNPAVQSQDGETTEIFMHTFISGGEDFEVAKPASIWEGYEDGTIMPSLVKPKKNRFKAQSGSNASMSTDMRTLFSTPFETLVPAKTTIPKGIHMGERIDNFLTLIKRYDHYANVALLGAESTNIYCPWILNFGEMTRWARVLRSFLFARGSYRVKLWCPTPTKQLVYISNYDPENLKLDIVQKLVDEGATLIDATQCAMVEAEIPYYCKYSMIGILNEYEVEGLPSFRVGMMYHGGLIVNANLFISASDDFTLGYPTAPVPWIKFVGTKKDDKASNSN